MEDKILVEQFVNGNATAFDKLVNKHKDMVFRVAYRMLGSHADASEVSQDVFVKLYGCLKEFEFRSKLTTYIYRIAVNYSKNRVKSMGTHSPISHDISNNKETHAKIQDALEKLNADHREIIILKEIEQMRYHEIAMVLGIDEGTVKSRLSRSRQALKTILETMELM